MCPVHNTVCPSSWSVYDLVDRPVPRKTGLYPDPDSAAVQPTVFYSDAGTRTLPVGTMISEKIIIEPIPSNYGRIAWNGHALTVY